jgi:hypothetical protein
MGIHIFIPISKGYLKTSVEISDSLLRQIREVAAREGVTLRTLVERGLHHVVAETRRETPFKLRRASFKGEGRQAEPGDGSWDRLRDLVYKGRVDPMRVFEDHDYRLPACQALELPDQRL